MLRQCQTQGCHRVYPGRHTHCCADCGGASGEHSRRCQRQQRRLWRGFRGARDADRRLPVASMTVCTTDGCGRLTGPGFDACCSRCGLSLGRSHSRRCQSNVRAGFGAPWNANMPASTSAPSDTNVRQRAHQLSHRPVITIVSSSSEAEDVMDGVDGVDGVDATPGAASTSTAPRPPSSMAAAVHETCEPDESASTALLSSATSTSPHARPPKNNAHGQNVLMQQCASKPVLNLFSMD